MTRNRPPTEAEIQAGMPGQVRSLEPPRMAHYHADTGDLAWAGSLDADCHEGEGYATAADAEAARHADEHYAALAELIERGQATDAQRAEYAALREARA